MNVFSDVRHAVRMLGKSPGFAAVAIATLALGIGANTAIFSVVESVLLRPLPYPEPDRLVEVFESNPERGFPQFSVSAPNYIDWRARNRSFQALGVYDKEELAWTRPGSPAERIPVTACTRELFSALAVAPALGRTFAAEELVREGPRAAVLGHALWRRAFGGDPAAVGRTIRLDGIDYPVVGVMPAGFEFPAGGAAAWIPLRFRADVQTQRGAHYLSVIGRLRPGVSVESANREMATIAGQISQENPGHSGWTAGAAPLAEQITGSSRPALTVLLGAVAFVLLIACANVANLLLARATGRQREIAIRMALGAGRGRILRQLLTESLVLAGAGSILGILLASWGISLLVRLGPADLPRLAETRLDPPVLLFALALAFASAALFGLVPALRTARTDVQEDLQAGGRSGGASREGARLRNAFVVAEVGLSLLLLSGAGLLLKSFAQLEKTDPGFRARSVLTYDVALPDTRYPDGPSGARFYDALLARTRAIPGVRSAAAIFGLPLTGFGFSSSFAVEGEPQPAPENEPSAQVRVVSRDYFSTLGIPLREGRGFEPSDIRGAPQVVLASAAAARKFWPSGGAIGHRVRFGARPGPDRIQGEIVGIVGDVRDAGLAREPVPFFYGALEQIAVDSVSVVVETSVPPRQLARPAAAAVAALDRDIPAAGMQTIGDILDRALARQRFATLLLTLFAGAALLLAAIGTYGVLSYTVGLRRRELGVRAALGAAPRTVLLLILRQGMTLAAFGTALGLAAAVAGTRVLSGLLFGVGPRDALVLGASAALLGTVAALASGVPAWRAARISPVEALRAE
jgi:putative ABC transport system permease protein